MDKIRDKIVVAIVIAILVGSKTPWWWEPLNNVLHPPVSLIPASMTGVWTGRIVNVPENGGSVDQCYVFASDGSGTVYDDPNYKHKPYALSGIKEANETLSFRFNAEGSTYPNLHELKLTAPRVFNVSIYNNDDKKLMQAGVVIHSDLKECPPRFSGN